MKKTIAATCLLMTGCASVTPPPDRIYWDEAPAHTQCTDDTSEVNTQYAGSLLAAGLGGWNIGASIALGAVPIVGLPLATMGIAGGADAGNKYKQIEECQEFKEYAFHRASKKDTNKTAEAKLKELQDMLDRSVITENEYKKARQSVIGQM